MSFDLKSFFERIEYSGGQEPTCKNLKEIQEHFLTHIPFENLDIKLKRPIKIDIDSIFKKLVIDKRGGYCFELNHLFQYALNAMGYKTRIVAARVKDFGKFGPEFDHLTTIVTMDDKEYVVDVGNGQFCRTPIQMDSDESYLSEGVWYTHKRITNPELETQGLELGHGMFRRSSPNQEWEIRYGFNDIPRKAEDFESGNIHHQTSKDSIFSKGNLITQATKTGRMTLTETKYNEVHLGKKTTISINSDAEFKKFLEEKFQIKIP